MNFDKLVDEQARLAALRRYDTGERSDNGPFQRVVELVQHLLNVPMAAVTLIDADTQRIKARCGLSDGCLSRDESFCTFSVAQAGPFAVSDALADPRFSDIPWVANAPHARSYLGVPLTTPDGYNIGALCALDSEPRQFERGHGATMTKLAELVVEQFELQQSARGDELTGLLSRRGFFNEVEKEFFRANRFARPSALVVLDVDHFSLINGRHGHRSGDAALVAIANACLTTLRRSDVIGRVGGEEFGLLLQETSAEAAQAVAERIRRLVESRIVATGNGKISATVSAGVVPLSEDLPNAWSWFVEAERAMNLAKQSGRNRVSVVPRRQPMQAPGDARSVERPILH